MAIVILALAIAGSAIYIFFTLLVYSGESTQISQQLEELKARLEERRQRLEEYQTQYEALQESVPAQRRRCDRLGRWVELLRAQKARVEAERPRNTQDRDRDEAIRKGLSARFRGKRG